MPKPPPNIPTAVGDRVKLRANTARSGTVREMTARMWVCVDWDDGVNRPKIVHQFELMTLPIDGSVESGVETSSTVHDPRAGLIEETAESLGKLQ